MLREELFVFRGIVFEWNADKAASNIAKHRVRFAEGATVFSDEEALMIEDPDHSNEEHCFILVGMSRMGRILVVVCLERGTRFRIISEATMKKAGSSELGEIRPEYDFSRGVRNPYAKRFAKGSNLVMIRPDLFAAFPSEEAVNEALEAVIRERFATNAG